MLVVVERTGAIAERLLARHRRHGRRFKIVWFDGRRRFYAATAHRHHNMLGAERTQLANNNWLAADAAAVPITETVAVAADG